MGMLTLLVACNGSSPTHFIHVDADGDGFVVGDDCNDALATAHPGAVEVPGDGLDQDCDGYDPSPPVVYTGATPNEGYGAHILFFDDRLIVSAPFALDGDGYAAGRVYAGEELAVQGEPGAFLGAGLAVSGDGTVYVGAPGVGRIYGLGGEIVFESPGVGGVIAARGSTWAASTAIGWVTSDGARVDLDRRPDALAITGNGGVVAGFARGETAVQVGDVSVERADLTDEAGYALLLADLDADGRDELVVGAPGAGRVYVFDPTEPPSSLADIAPIGPGTGRFGASLAVGVDGALYVGAPAAGSEVEGAVYMVRGGEVTVLGGLTCPAGRQCGSSLAAAHANLAVGAPAAADEPGYAQLVVP